MIRFAENLNKMITAGLGGALEAPSTEVAVGHRVRYMDASGPVASFETNVVAPIRSLRVDMLPIQAGSGDPSPDNIRPISGRDSVTVTRTGVNLFPNPSGARSAVDLKAGVEYCFSAKGVSSAVAVSGKYADGTTFPTLFLNKLSGDIRYNSRVLEKDVSEIIIYLNNVTLYDCQIEVGSTPSAYAPYDGASVTVQLSTTVYGGTVDVTGGKVHVTHELVDMSAIPWSPYAASNASVGKAYAYFSSISGAKPTLNDPDVISSSLRYIGNGNITRTKLYDVGSYYSTSFSSYLYVHLYDGEYHTREEWQAKLAEMGAKIILPLAEPFDIDIDPATPSTLKGGNNVWSDAGDITLEYPYYEEMEGY